MLELVLSFSFSSNSCVLYFAINASSSLVLDIYYVVPLFSSRVTRFLATQSGRSWFHVRQMFTTLPLYARSLVNAFLFYDDIPEDFLACDPGVESNRCIVILRTYVYLYEEVQLKNGPADIFVSVPQSLLRVFV